METGHTAYSGKEAAHDSHDPFPLLREIGGIPFVAHLVVYLY